MPSLSEIIVEPIPSVGSGVDVGDLSTGGIEVIVILEVFVLTGVNVRVAVGFDVSVALSHVGVWVGVAERSNESGKKFVSDPSHKMIIRISNPAMDSRGIVTPIYGGRRKGTKVCIGNTEWHKAESAA